MIIMTVDEAQKHLKELVSKVKEGESVVLMDQDQPVAEVIAKRAVAKKARKRGSGKGLITYMSDDFDEPLEDFKEYMP